MIQEIEVSLAYGITTLPKSKQFNLSTYCIGDFFLRLLGDFTIGKVKKIVIECSEKEILKPTNIADDSLNVVIIRKPVEVEAYLRLPVKDKKKWTLKILVESFKELNKFFDFSIEKVLEIQKIIESCDYVNHYHYGKLVVSPGKKSKAQLWIQHEVDGFSIFVDVFDVNGKLEKRYFVITTIPNWVAYVPVLGVLKWESDKFVSLIGKNKKVIKKIKI